MKRKIPVKADAKAPKNDVYTKSPVKVNDLDETVNETSVAESGEYTPQS